MKYAEKPGLVDRAKAKATGANIHSINVLCGYYRSAVSIGNSYWKMGLEEKETQRREEIARLEELLEHIVNTGSFPPTNRGGT